jgi:hypothetical protein
VLVGPGMTARERVFGSCLLSVVVETLQVLFYCSPCGNRLCLHPMVFPPTAPSVEETTLS